MSDRMTPIPFSGLMEWMLEEKRTRNTVFGVHRPFAADAKKNLKLFGKKLETPVGPAAGPHTQLAQNLIAAYYAGGRFFELKTVQILDGEDLPVEKPCILAEDEGYNVEWSTELYVPQAFEEYVKAWFAIQVMAREWGLGSPEGFCFNMSVGYDLDGIRSEKIDRFIEGMKHAGETEAYKECQEYLLRHAEEYAVMTREDILSLPGEICNCATLSTLHGCPPKEMERIAGYLLSEKGLHTFIKCNPTLLGYDFARRTLDERGYDYIAFDDFHFKDDLQYSDAIPMLGRLSRIAEERGLEFGVKLTNTFPVDIRCGELPGKEMYMSGRALYPLSIALAARLAEDFDGSLRISYSGGADYYNVDKLFAAGIWPVTMATTLLKPGGYQRMEQIAGKLAPMEYREFAGVDVKAVKELALQAGKDPRFQKAVKPRPSRKGKKKVPLLDCFMAPCEEACPIHQDITAYMKLAGEGSYEEALKVITLKNPLPFITGTICAHSCMSKCNRNYYEEPVKIREMKLLAAENGYDGFMRKLQRPRRCGGKKTAVVGGGPAGMAAAYFLAREGRRVTVFEAREALGGIVRYAIPEFRISGEAIDKDAALLEAMGAEVEVNTRISRLEELAERGYDDIVLAIGAGVPGALRLSQGTAWNALEFLERLKQSGGRQKLGTQVAVIGGGNTAMDAARAAIRADGVEGVSLVYRRTRRYMPADEEELQMALEEGVTFRELLSPVSIEEGYLICKKMELGQMDSSGRRSPAETGELVRLRADTVVAATGEKVNTAFYKENKIAVDERGCALVNAKTLETSRKGVYVAGDGLAGPAAVAEAIRDAKLAAGAILGRKLFRDLESAGESAVLYEKRGILLESGPGMPESSRCLDCSSVCENCVEVCPNRANFSIEVEGMQKAQIIHMDALCNECGNCRSFCPYDSAPFRDKFTLFSDKEALLESANEGFCVMDADAEEYLVRLGQKLLTVTGENRKGVPKELFKVMDTTCRNYFYLLF